MPARDNGTKEKTLLRSGELALKGWLFLKIKSEGSCALSQLMGLAQRQETPSEAR